MEAKKHEAVQYQSLIQKLTQMRACLASGYPFVFGFTVCQSFESEEVATSNIVPMPLSNEKAVGGHAVLAVCCDDSRQRFMVRNFMGLRLGMKGYFTMPYDISPRTIYRTISGPFVSYRRSGWNESRHSKGAELYTEAPHRRSLLPGARTD